jgi:hypothetical protein
MHKMVYVFVALMVLPALGCGSTSTFSQPETAVLPITLGNDLTTIEVCQAIP